MRSVPLVTFLLVLLLALRGAGPARGESTALPGAAVEAVVAAGVDLAAKGYLDEAAEVLDVLDLLGVGGEPKDRLRKAMAKAAGRARARGRFDPAALTRAAAALGEAASKASPGPERATWAEQGLRLRAADPASRAVLDHVLVEGAWTTRLDQGAIARRRALEEGAARARALPIDVSVGPSDHPLLAGPKGPARAAHSASFDLHARHLTEEELARAARAAARVLAFCWWTKTGELVAPAGEAPLEVVLFPTLEAYHAWVDATIDGERRAFARELSSWFSPTGVVGCRPIPVDALTRALVWYGFGRDVGPQTGASPTASLAVGLVNAASLLVLGLPLMRLADLRIEESGESKTTDEPLAARRRRVDSELAAGLLGTRAWLRDRARRGTDPPWRDVLLERPAKLGGPLLAKATSLAEHLLETERYWALAEVVSAASEAELPEALAAGLGTTVPEGEARWRAWLLAGEGFGLVERLGAAGGDGAGKDRAWLLALDEMRKAARLGGWKEGYVPVLPDPDLHEGCRRHVGYLRKNPDLATRWPDMHEERTDRPGFSPLGARAAGASVIAWGQASTADAVDLWMSTFYHRLPLLDVGLRRIGWALEGGVAVLDAGSFVARPERGIVVWPAPDARDVPRRFAFGEVPHPVPGEDASRWGYPITVQLFPEDGTSNDIEIVVRKGGPAGPPVAGHLLTPSRHDQPLFHPPNASCFIPKAALEAGTTYHVDTKGFPDWAQNYWWTFTTGR